MTRTKLEKQLEVERKELAGLIAERAGLKQKLDGVQQQQTNGLAGIGISKLLTSARQQVERRIDAETWRVADAELARRVEAQQAAIAETERALVQAQVEEAQAEIDALELEAAKALHAFLEATAKAEAAYQKVLGQARAHGLRGPSPSFDAAAVTGVQQALAGYGRQYARRTGQEPEVQLFVSTSKGMEPAPSGHFVKNAFA